MPTILIYALAALAEIAGCFAFWAVLRLEKSAWWLVPGGLSLALFAWLLTLHEAAAGRVYAAYGGAYIAVAIAWLWAVDGIRPTPWDLAGSAIALAGMGVIAFQPR